MTAPTETTTAATLEESRYFKAVVERAVPVIRRLAEGDATPKSDEVYAVEVFRRTTRLHSCLERLFEVPAFIRRFPKSETWEKSGISRPKWTGYHAAMFHITAVGIADAAQLLVAEVFELGLQPRDCTHRTVRKNLHVRGTKADDALGMLDALSSPYRKERNAFVHHGATPDLKDLEMLEMALWLDSRRHAPALSPQVFQHRLKGLRAELANDMTKTASQFVAATGALFDALADEFDGRPSAAFGRYFAKLLAPASDDHEATDETTQRS